MLETRIDIKFNNRHSVSKFISNIDDFDKFIKNSISEHEDNYTVELRYPYISKIVGTTTKIRAVLKLIYKYESYINPENIEDTLVFKNILNDKFPWLRLI